MKKAFLKKTFAGIGNLLYLVKPYWKYGKAYMAGRIAIEALIAPALALYQVKLVQSVVDAVAAGKPLNETVGTAAALVRRKRAGQNWRAQKTGRAKLALEHGAVHGMALVPARPTGIHNYRRFCPQPWAWHYIWHVRRCGQAERHAEPICRHIRQRHGNQLVRG